MKLKYNFNSQSKMISHLNVVYFQMFEVVETILLLEEPWARPMRGLPVCSPPKYELKKKQVLYAFFWVISRLLNFVCQRFGTLSVPSSFPPMKMEQTECSEKLAYKIQTAGNYPEESKQHSEYGES